MAHPDDCPCCGEQGYVKDGICITCGWGDLDHVALARAYWDTGDRLAALAPDLLAALKEAQWLVRQYASRDGAAVAVLRTIDAAVARAEEPA